MKHKSTSKSISNTEKLVIEIFNAEEEIEMGKSVRIKDKKGLKKFLKEL